MSMQHIDPRTVLSPRASVSNLKVVYDGGVWVADDPWAGWSLAEMHWDGRPSVGARWNGELGEGVGNPQSRGIATWFVLPPPVAEVALERVLAHIRQKENDEDGIKIRPPRDRMRDLIIFLRNATDTEFHDFLKEAGFWPKPKPTAKPEGMPIEEDLSTRT